MAFGQVEVEADPAPAMEVIWKQTMTNKVEQSLHNSPSEDSCRNMTVSQSVLKLFAILVKSLQGRESRGSPSVWEVVSDGF